MKQSEELRELLHSIHRKSYPAYKGLKGIYDFGPIGFPSTMCRVTRSLPPPASVSGSGGSGPASLILI